MGLYWKLLGPSTDSRIPFLSGSSSMVSSSRLTDRRKSRASRRVVSSKAMTGMMMLLSLLFCHEISGRRLLGFGVMNSTVPRPTS